MTTEYRCPYKEIFNLDIPNTKYRGGDCGWVGSTNELIYEPIGSYGHHCCPDCGNSIYEMSIVADNKTTFTWNDKTYQLDIEPLKLLKLVDPLIKLPNDELLKISSCVDTWKKGDHPPLPLVYSIDHSVLNATEIDEEELTFETLLKEYKLTDNLKSRKLWGKCKELSMSMAEQIDFFHLWVDLILD